VVLSNDVIRFTITVAQSTRHPSFRTSVLSSTRRTMLRAVLAASQSPYSLKSSSAPFPTCTAPIVPARNDLQYPAKGTPALKSPLAHLPLPHHLLRQNFQRAPEAPSTEFHTLSNNKFHLSSSALPYLITPKKKSSRRNVLPKKHRPSSASASSSDVTREGAEKPHQSA